MNRAIITGVGQQDAASPRISAADVLEWPLWYAAWSPASVDAAFDSVQMYAAVAVRCGTEIEVGFAAAEKERLSQLLGLLVDQVIRDWPRVALRVRLHSPDAQVADFCRRTLPAPEPAAISALGMNAAWIRSELNT